MTTTNPTPTPLSLAFRRLLGLPRPPAPFLLTGHLLPHPEPVDLRSPSPQAAQPLPLVRPLLVQPPPQAPSPQAGNLVLELRLNRLRANRNRDRDL